MKRPWPAIALLLSCAPVFGADLPPVATGQPASGVIISRREFRAADLSIAPDLVTLGGYFSRFNTGNPMHGPNVPTILYGEFTVQTTDGRHVHVTQPAQSELQPGAHVLIQSVDGHPSLSLAP